MLKIYPSLVIENTPLYEEYKEGRYIPYSDEEPQGVSPQKVVKVSEKMKERCNEQF